jgi:hypothetical protein
MSLTPLKVNTLGALVQNQGLYINPESVGYMGSSTALNNYTKGSLISLNSLGILSDAIRLAFTKIGSGVTSSTYNNLISIGSASIPILGLSKPSTYTNTYTGEITSYGWLRLFPYQAHKEFYINNGSYSDFLATFNSSYGTFVLQNETINALNKSTTYLDGIYSNMNDLITGDITGVSLSTFYWGQDLISLGKALDLAYIDKFGNPQYLLMTLYKNQALTTAVNTCLLSAGLTSTDIASLSNGVPATTEQLKLLYAAFSLIIGNDLSDVCVPLNCQIQGLETLADLLDPKKLFPNSYSTLTYPKYNSIPLPTNSKTYFLIYSGNEVNVDNSTNIGQRLLNIIPPEIAYAADAFAISMMQIKNIKTTSIEKFSQVVTNLENVSDLQNVNGTNIPTNTGFANAAITQIAKGSGKNNLYTMCDFFGSMTSLHYNWKLLNDSLSGLISVSLASIYTNMYSLLAGPGPYTNLQNFITQANNEIINILDANLSKGSAINAIYNDFGTKLTKEENARSLALGNLTELQSSVNDTVLFIDNLQQYANNTEIEGAAQVLENIADITTEGGNNLIAAMREARNAQRLGLAGLTQDNQILVGTTLALPRVSGSTLNESPIEGYPNSDTLNDIPIITGAATVLGSLAGSSETTLVPDNLSILVQPSDKSVLAPDIAVEEVTLCNCDCWDLL